MQLGSSSVLPEFGIDRPEKINDQFEARVEQSIRVSARQMTDVEKVARIDAITIERRQGRPRVTIAYTDLTTNLSDEVSA